VPLLRLAFNGNIGNTLGKGGGGGKERKDKKKKEKKKH
jgi:hypothetical protein